MACVMVKIRPIRTICSLPEKALAFSANAYSTADDEVQLNRQERDYSYLHIVKPALFHNFRGESTYRFSRDKLTELIESGIVKEEEDAIFVYEQVKDEHHFRGIIAGAAISDYLNGKIKKHEKTRVDKENEITEYFEKVGINGSPVMLAYPFVPGIEKFIREAVEREPMYDFTDEVGVHHRLWRLDDSQQVRKVEGMFEKLDALYIADGHHRCAAAARCFPQAKGEFMAFLIADNILSIYSYNRLVSELNDQSEEQLLERLSRNFTITRLNKRIYNPEKEGVIGLYLPGKWYKLEVKPGLKSVTEVKEKLDVSILERYALLPIWGVKDSRIDPRLTFMDGAVGTEALMKEVDEGRMAAAFALYPVSIEAIFAISDKNEVMPPKSTWVEPKLRSGLVIHKIIF